MTGELTDATRDSRSTLPLIALSIALIAAIVGLIYTANVERPSVAPSHAVVTGDLQVSYMLITSKTANSEESSGSTINASRVEYFPTYVLVTTRSDVTVLWTIDRLKKLEVSRVAHSQK